MATYRHPRGYKDHTGGNGVEGATRRSGAAVPAASHSWTLCPHCSKSNPVANLVAWGCYSCGQMPNQPGRSFPLVKFS